MAGDWIKMRGNLWDDPRVSALVDATDSSEAAVVGALYWLWAAADQHTENGLMPGLTLRQIDRKTGVTGFAAALVSIGWITDHPDGITIVKFEDHNGTSAKRRSEDAKRKADVRKVSDKSKTDAGIPADILGRLVELEKELEKEKEKNKDSVAKATGVKPPITDPDEIIFGYGLALLTNAGTFEKQARSFLGGLRKHHGDEALIDKLRECAKAKPLQPLEWLAASLPPKGSEPKLNKQEALEAQNDAVATRFIERMTNATQ